MSRIAPARIQLGLTILIVGLAGGVSATSHAAGPDEIAKKLAIAFGATDFGLLPIQAFFIASVTEEIACDPAMCRVVINYRAPVSPSLPKNLPSINRSEMAETVFGPAATSETATLLAAATDAQGMVVAFEASVSDTVLRRYTAKTEKDQEAENTQTQHVDILIAGTADAKKRANAAWDALADHCRERGLSFVAGSADPHAAVEKWRRSPMPKVELGVLRAFGVDTETIDGLRKRVEAAGEKGDYPRNFEDWITAIKAVNDQNDDIRQCRCVEP